MFLYLLIAPLCACAQVTLLYNDASTFDGRVFDVAFPYCATLAASAGYTCASTLPFLAFTGAPPLNVTDPSLPVVGPAGGLIAASWPSFFNATALLNESLRSAGIAGTVFWSGFAANGAQFLNCANWTYNTPGTCSAAKVGSFAALRRAWLFGNYACDALASLLCVCTQGTTRAPSAAPSVSPSRAPSHSPFLPLPSPTASPTKIPTLA